MTLPRSLVFRDPPTARRVPNQVPGVNANHKPVQIVRTNQTLDTPSQ
jgi:hypothetical protein